MLESGHCPLFGEYMIRRFERSV